MDNGHGQFQHPTDQREIEFPAVLVGKMFSSPLVPNTNEQAELELFYSSRIAVPVHIQGKALRSSLMRPPPLLLTCIVSVNYFVHSFSGSKLIYYLRVTNLEVFFVLKVQQLTNRL